MNNPTPANFKMTFLLFDDSPEQTAKIMDAIPYPSRVEHDGQENGCIVIDAPEGEIGMTVGSYLMVGHPDEVTIVSRVPIARE